MIILPTLRAPLAAGFNPLALSPLLWLDAADSTSLYDATSGGSLVAADGAIARWQDKSGNANHGTQATSGARPTRKTALQNGRDVVRFDGSNDTLSYGTSLFTYTAPRSIFVLHRNLTVASSSYAGFLCDYNGAGQSIIVGPAKYPNSGLQPSTDVYGPGGMAYGSTSGTPTAAHLSEYHWSNWSTHKSNGSTILALDGSEVAGTAYGNNPTGFTSFTRTIGSTPGSFINGDLCEILVFSSLLSSTDRLRVRRYLGAKWGVTIP